MIPVQAYRCQHCGRLFMRGKNCVRHEETFCMKNEDLHPLCWSCVHFDPYYGFDRDRVKFLRSDDGEYEMKEFSPYKCTYLTDKHKLYYNIRLDKDLQAELAKHGYRPMPTRKSGGCPNYQLAKINSNEND